MKNESETEKNATKINQIINRKKRKEKSVTQKQARMQGPGQNCVLCDRLAFQMKIIGGCGEQEASIGWEKRMPGDTHGHAQRSVCWSPTHGHIENAIMPTGPVK